MPKQPIGRALTALGTSTSHPAAFLIVLVYAGLWLAFDHDSFDMHGAATLATWLMTLFIQRAEHRDTQAIQQKLDEMLRAIPGARNEVATVDQRQPEEIAAHRAAEARSGPQPLD